MEISPVSSTDASKTGKIKQFRASTGLEVTLSQIKALKGSRIRAESGNVLNVACFA